MAITTSTFEQDDPRFEGDLDSGFRISVSLLPSPELLKNYESVLPGSASRILKLTEFHTKETARRKQLEEEYLRSETARLVQFYQRLSLFNIGLMIWCVVFCVVYLIIRRFAFDNLSGALIGAIVLAVSTYLLISNYLVGRQVRKNLTKIFRLSIDRPTLSADLDQTTCASDLEES